MRMPLDTKATSAVKLCLAALCVLTLFSPAAHAVDPNRRISQYGHVAWRLQDGFFNGAPQAITQTGDGYLWIGTSNGLFRFDGEHFKQFHKPSGDGLTSGVNSLLAAKDGSLWYTSGASLGHVHDGVLKEYWHESHKRHANDVIEDKNGNIWVAYSRTPLGKSLCRVKGSGLVCYGAGEGVPLPTASHLAADAEATLWVSSSAQLESWRNGQGQVFSPSALSSVAGFSGFSALSASFDGSMWVGINRIGTGLGLQHVSKGKWLPLALPGFDSTRLRVSALLEDRERSLWIGTESDGLYHVSGGRVDHYKASNGLSGDSVSAIYQDREGDIWVATSRGLDKLRDTFVITYSADEGLTSGVADAVTAANDGSVWSGAGEDLIRLKGGTTIAIDKKRGLPGAQVTVLLADKRGRLWVGVDHHLFLYKGGRFTPVDLKPRLPVPILQEIAEDTAGAIWLWAAGDTFVSRVSPDGVVNAVPTPGSRDVRSLGPDRHGGLWVAFDDGTLARYENEKWALSPALSRAEGTRVNQLVATEDDLILGRTVEGLIGWSDGRRKFLGVSNGLPCKHVNSIVFDRSGTLWSYAECGLFSISASELKRWWQHPEAQLRIETFDALDGVEPGAANFRPRSVLAADGTLWFANGTVLQQIDPSKSHRNVLVPPVYVEALTADRKPYQMSGDLRLPPLSRDIQIDYNALSFPIPERVRFRYRLEGWDKDWQDASTRRQAFYTNLGPGSYRFHVIACNSDGVWNENGASIEFSIAPRYYQTTWFLILCALSLVLLTWIAYLFRLRQATARIQERLGARLEERERIARELHDTLLQGVQGLMLRFQGISKTLPADAPTSRMMNDALDRADELMLQARQGVKDIRAAGMTDSDLPDMLKTCAEDLQQDNTAALKLSFLGSPRPLDVTVCTEAYRIAREAMTNAFQHAKAQSIEVEVTYESDSLRINVRDNGDGIEPELLSKGKTDHWGLSGMRERAEKIGGRLRIWSQPRAGTEVELSVPGRLAYVQSVKTSLWNRIRRKSLRKEK